MRNDLLRGGLEKMLDALGMTEVASRRDLRGGLDTARGRSVLIARLAEVDGATVADLRAAVRAGMRVLLLVADGDLELVEPGWVLDGVGYLGVDDLDERALHNALCGTDGASSLPSGLARWLPAILRQRATAASAAPRLTPRERQVLALLVEGLSNKQIARRLRISEHGAKRLVANILAKLDCPNRTLAVARAVRDGVV
ncbi:response regulator transcription factor [Herbihabitans rhizosphaerae]|nr:response regulator transcription factor [Herbihabitans rhizosphaerae]